MKVNVIGIGKMGFPLVENMLDQKHEVYVYDVSEELVQKMKTKNNVDGTTDLKEFVDNALENEKHRVFWLMLPPGDITTGVLNELREFIKEDDVVVDAGNSNHNVSVEQGKLYADKGAYFFDVGTSGGVSGARHGASLMIGGDKDVYDTLFPFFESISMENGYLYTGKTGSAHFLKLVHNAIYYGYQQALGEGLEILHASDFDYDLAEVTKVLSESSVIRGWLLELMHEAFANDANLENYSGHVKGSKSTNWVIEEAMDLGVPVPAMAVSVAMRHRGVQDDESFGGKVISALRSGVGGFDKK